LPRQITTGTALIPLALADAWALPPGPTAVAVAVTVWSEVIGQVAWLPVPDAHPDQLTDVAFVAVAVNVAVQAGWQSPDEVTVTVGGQGPVVNERSPPAVWPPTFVPTTRKW
jgi:hypothetical protein